MPSWWSVTDVSPCTWTVTSKVISLDDIDHPSGDGRAPDRVNGESIASETDPGTYAVLGDVERQVRPKGKSGEGNASMKHCPRDAGRNGQPRRLSRIVVAAIVEYLVVPR